ncbi:MAG TPA: acyltransferase family protein [Pedomonas sp.]|uniref:acyltransferase family protein n=1 Tax=Pedomonas sp. TaxID=2976421 RepID=UPI002F401753
MKYRPEVDGLRSFAVVPVILFHAGVPGFTGGFVGVDVFFAISGFLITSILLREMEEGRFSFIDFYVRRARRILPALFLVTAVSMPIAWLWLPHLKFNDFFQSTFALAFFASNLLFWKESDYFAAEAEEKPMLHTWSLAVEEQFYIVFPVLIALLWPLLRNRRNFWISVIALLAAASLVASEWGWRNAPSTNFYLAPFRAWELLLGALSAWIYASPNHRSNGVLATLGLAMVLVSVFFYDESVPFPSVYAALPVVGTCLILLYASRESLTGKFLSMRPFVGIGLLSYSLYLWHQPLLAFARARLLHEPPLWLMVSLALLTLPLAYLSWRYVETPARRPAGSMRGDWRPLVRWATLTAIVAGVSFASLYGRPLFLPADKENAVNVRGLASNCESSSLEGCTTAPTPHILVWGDSYAMHSVPAVTALFQTEGVAQYTKSACNPVRGIAQMAPGQTREWAQQCIQFNDKLVEVLNRNPSINTVIISTQLANLFHTPVQAADGASLGVLTADELLTRIGNTLDMLGKRGLTVYWISPPPWPAYGKAGDCARKEIHFSSQVDACNFELTKRSPESLTVASFLQRLSALGQKQPDFHLVDLTEALCATGRCQVGEGTRYFYGNGGHLSLSGSLELATRREFASAFNKVPAPSELKTSQWAAASCSLSREAC